MAKTTYHNGWTREKICEYVEARQEYIRLVYNSDIGCRYDMGNGETYEVVITDYTPRSYPFTENFYINGVLAQVSRHE